MEVFWSKGYEGTSIDDLCEATGVKRQSLYNALGDKKAMFVQSLLMYGQEEGRAALAQLEAATSGRGALEFMFTSVIENCTNDKSRRGCFLVNTALEAGHDDDVQRVFRAAMKDFEQFFERSLRRGQEEGEIHESIDVPSTAAGLMGTYIGIRVMARGPNGSSLIQRMAQHALRSIDTRGVSQ